MDTILTSENESFWGGSISRHCVIVQEVIKDTNDNEMQIIDNLLISLLFVARGVALLIITEDTPL